MRMRVTAPFIDVETGLRRQPGEMLDVSPERAERMRRAAVAEPVQESAPERAALELPEQAVYPANRQRRGRR